MDSKRLLTFGGAMILAAVLSGCSQSQQAQRAQADDTAVVQTEDRYGSHWGELRNSEGQPVGIYAGPRS